MDPIKLLLEFSYISDFWIFWLALCDPIFYFVGEEVLDVSKLATAEHH